MNVPIILHQYSQFADCLKKRSRYVLDRAGNQILNIILDESKSRSVEVTPHVELWRAQIAHVTGTVRAPTHSLIVSKPAPVERMIPWRDRAKEGRANSKGIPVLYCATTRNTAIAEVRPWIGAQITVARLIAQKTLRLVDFGQTPKRRSFSDIRTQEDANDAFGQ